MSKMTSMKRTRLPNSKFWCVTINNPVDVYQEKDLFLEEEDKLIYAVWQLEMGDSGTPHIQGYFILKKSQNLSYVKNMLGDNIHAEIANGTPQENKVYCTKKDHVLRGPWEFGTIPESKQGKRNDLLDIQKKLDTGVPMLEIARSNFCSFIRYNRGFETYLATVTPKRSWKTQVIVLTGEPGIGKSYWAAKNSKDTFYCFSPKWWDGYNGTGDIVINDFNGEMPYSQLLNMMDEGPWTLESKGGVKNCAPRRLIITSNEPMANWYDFRITKGTFGALERRVDYLWEPIAPPNVHYFTDEWTKNNVITCPYPFEEQEDTLDWDAICDACPEYEEVRPKRVKTLENAQDLENMSQLSTWDENDEGHSLNSSWWDKDLDEDDPVVKAARDTVRDWYDAEADASYEELDIVLDSD